MSFQNTVTRNLSYRISAKEIKKLRKSDAGTFYEEPFLVLSTKSGISTIQFLSERISQIEKAVMGRVKLRPEFEYLQTVPGIGKILGLTIILEVGDIGRFSEVGNYQNILLCHAGPGPL